MPPLPAKLMLDSTRKHVPWLLNEYRPWHSKMKSKTCRKFRWICLSWKAGLLWRPLFIHSTNKMRVGRKDYVGVLGWSQAKKSVLVPYWSGPTAWGLLPLRGARGPLRACGSKLPVAMKFPATITINICSSTLHGFHSSVPTEFIKTVSTRGLCPSWAATPGHDDNP